MAETETETTAPIFILSTARAGSTLLRYVVDTHPRVYVPAEVYLGRLACSLYRTVSCLAGEGIFQPTPYHLESHPEVLARVRQQLEQLMEDATSGRGKDIWCEKTPDNLDHLELLTRLFPEARFLCLYRHYRDVTSSCLKVSRHGFITVLEEYIRRTPGDSLEAIASYWADSVSAQLALEERPEVMTHRMRYEDLVADPEVAMGRVFAFLGLDWDPGLLDKVFQSSHDEGIGDGYVRYAGRIHRDSLGKGADLPLDRLPVDLKGRLATLTSALGYDTEPRPTEATTPAAGSSGGGDGGGGRSAVSTPGGAMPRAIPVGGGRAVRLLFDTVLPARLRSRSGAQLPNISVRFEVLGEGGGDWVLEISDEGIQVIPGAVEAACRLTLSGADLLAIVQGKANALELVEEGRIQVAGTVDDGALQQVVLLLRTDV